MKRLIIPFLLMFLICSCVSPKGVYTIGGEGSTQVDEMAQLKVDSNPNFDFQKLDILEFDGRDMNMAVTDKPNKFMAMPKRNLQGNTYVPKAAIFFPAGEHEFRFRWEAANMLGMQTHSFWSPVDAVAKFNALQGKTYLVQTRMGFDENSKGEGTWHWKLVEVETGKVVIPEDNKN